MIGYSPFTIHTQLVTARTKLYSIQARPARSAKLKEEKRLAIAEVNKVIDGLTDKLNERSVSERS